MANEKPQELTVSQLAEALMKESNSAGCIVLFLHEKESPFGMALAHKSMFEPLLDAMQSAMDQLKERAAEFAPEESAPEETERGF